MHTLVNLQSSAAPCVLSLHTRIGVGTHLEIAVRASFKRRIRQFKVLPNVTGVLPVACCAPEHPSLLPGLFKTRRSESDSAGTG